MGIVRTETAELIRAALRGERLQDATELLLRAVTDLAFEVRRGKQREDALERQLQLLQQRVDRGEGVHGA